MKMIVDSMISGGLSVLFIVANYTSAVPVTRIINDSLRNRENNPGFLSSHQKNLAPLTPKNVHEITTSIASSTRNIQPADNERGQVSGNLLRSSFKSRTRRQAEESLQCVVSADLPVVDANDLDTPLNATTFLGLNPSLLEESDGNRQWPGLEENLRASCPWRLEIANMSVNGAEVYPRHVRQAKCLCDTCRNANGYNCIDLRQPITVFQKIGCNSNGLAVMLQIPKNITVGCYCQRPAPNNS